MTASRESIPFTLAALLTMGTTLIARPDVNREPGPMEYGYRPKDGQVCHVTPPPFVWVSQKGAKTYQVQVSPNERFTGAGVRTFSDIVHNLHTPTETETIRPGDYWWRYRCVDGRGRTGDWSRSRGFTIDDKARPFPFVTPEQCRERIPKQHPRLFLRPEEVRRLRRRIDHDPDIGGIFDEILDKADALLTAKLIPEPTVMARPHDPKTRKYWWPNRVTTIKALTAADTLAFAYLITGQAKYGKAARKWILHTAGWNPHGPTNLLLNDEAAMPFLYLLPRAYDWAYDALSKDDRTRVRQVMEIRAKAAYLWLNGLRFMNCPFESHNNRLWHWLGESAICFYDEIDDAPKWLDYALNYSFAIYPVWGGIDGGWHEGANYWNSYVYRSLYWMDIARSALRFEAHTKSYYQRIGDFALYVVPPNAPVGGFGDLSHYPPGRNWRYTIEYFARRIRNPYWQWWAEQKGGKHERGIYGLLRRIDSKPIRARRPSKLPTSKLFRGIGVAALHNTILDSRDDVAFLFKSSPYGGQSHGHNPQNSFILCAYGDELLSACVYRDEHGGKWHRNWAWSTSAHNAMLVDGRGQPKNSPRAQGRITAFKTTRNADYLVGDATNVYSGVKRYHRHVVFAKPDMIVLLDDVATRKPATFQWMLHGLKEFQIDRKAATANLERSKAGVDIAYLPDDGLNLDFAQSSGYRPEPKTRMPIQWHLRAGTTEKRDHVLMLTVLAPYRRGDRPRVSVERVETDTAVGCKIRSSGKTRYIAFRKPEIATRAKLGPLSFNGSAAVLKGTRKTTFHSEIDQ